MEAVRAHPRVGLMQSVSISESLNNFLCLIFFRFCPTKSDSAYKSATKKQI
jgi:hypothetical protein